MREVAQRVSLRAPHFIAHVFVAAREAHRLEADDGDLVGVRDGKVEDGADLIVIDAVDDGDDEHDVDACGVEVLDGAQLHVEEVAHFAMGAPFVGNGVELKIGEAQPALLREPRELRLLREANAVGRALHAEIADLARVARRLQEMRRERRLAARELHAHLPARLDGERVVQDFLDLVPLELVHVADLIGVHEARVAHHVAAIGEVDGQDGAAPVLNARRAVIAQRRERREVVATRVEVLDAARKGGVDREDVLEVAVLRARLFHLQHAVDFVDVRADLAGLPVDERRQITLAGENLGPYLLHAARTQRVCVSRPSELREGALAALEQRRGGPLRVDGRLLEPDVVALHERPRGASGARKRFLCKARCGELKRHRRSLLAIPKMSTR